jgi:hypothetical protein
MSAESTSQPEAGATPAGHPPMRRGTVRTEVQTPLWATVLASICIVFAVLGALIALFSAGVPLFSGWTQGFGQSNQGFLAPFKAVGSHSRLYAAVGVVLLLLAGLQLAGGIGLINARRWCRPALLSFALLKMVMAGLELWLSIVVTHQQQIDMAAANLAPPPAAAGMINMVVLGLNTAWKCVWPIFLLVWFNRPSIKQQIRKWG